jgi:hypothetical protein
MRRLLILSFSIVLAASAVFGQTNGYIGIFGDQAGMDPCMTDAGAGVRYFYILHVNATGATASQFATPAPWCLRGQYLADIPLFPVVLGSSQNGVAVGYGSCRVGTFHILTMLFQMTAVTPNCCCWDVAPDPNLPSGRIEIPDCDFSLTYGTGGRAIINPSENCPCSWCASPACLEAFYAQTTGCLLPTPADESTWGRVKALYTD